MVWLSGYDYLLPNQGILQGGGSNPSRDPHQCHTSVFLKDVIAIFQACAFRTWLWFKKFSEWEALSKILWAAIFKKTYKTPILYRKSPPNKKRDRQTQTKLSERKKGMW